MPWKQHKDALTWTKQYCCLCWNSSIAKLAAQQEFLCVSQEMGCWNPPAMPTSPHCDLCCSALPSTGQWEGSPGVAETAESAYRAAQSCARQGLSRWTRAQLTLSSRACGWIFQHILFEVLSHSQAFFFMLIFFSSLYTTTKKKKQLLWDGNQFVYRCYLSHARIRK